MKTILISILLFLLVAGCSFNKEFAEGKSMPKDQVSLIMATINEGKLKKDMSPEEVVCLMGEPSWKIHPLFFPSKELWVYTSHGIAYETFVGFGRKVHLGFQDKKLKEAFINLPMSVKKIDLE